jgi:hypothetical protein
MRHIAEFLKKVLSATPRYATQCEIKVKRFLVYSALCGTAGSRLRAMRHSVESIFVVEYLRAIETICKTVKPMIQGAQGYSQQEKPRVENLVRLSLLY